MAVMNGYIRAIQCTEENDLHFVTPQQATDEPSDGDYPEVPVLIRHLNRHNHGYGLYYHRNPVRLRHERLAQNPQVIFKSSCVNLKAAYRRYPYSSRNTSITS